MAEQLYKRGSVWWAWGYDRAGKRWSRSTKQRDKGAARIVAAQLSKDLALEADSPRHQTTLDDAISDLIESAERGGKAEATIEIHTEKGSHLVRLLGKDTLIDTITLDKTTKYAFRRLDEGASKHTVHKEIRTLVQALRRAEKLGRYRPKAPPSMLMPEELDGAYVPRERWLTPAEYLELLAELDPKRTKHTRSEDRRDYLAVFVQTGMRDSELYAVRAEHCDFAALEIEVQGTKTKGSRRRVPMTPAVEQILRRRAQAQMDAQKKGASPGPLFPAWSMVRGELSAACTRIEKRLNPGWEPPAHEGEDGERRRRAGLPPPKSTRVPPPRPFEPVTPNDLRRTFASWLAQAGVPLHHASKLMGHSSTKMLEQVYARLAPQTLRSAIEKLPEAVTAAPGYAVQGPRKDDENG